MYKKFNNIRTICNLGHNHPSRGESIQCEALHLLLRAPQSDLKSIEYERPYSIVVNGIKICVHKPDFTMNYVDRVEIVEYKGFPTADWKLKRKLFIACYPAIKYNTVYQKPRKLSNRAKFKAIAKRIKA